MITNNDLFDIYYVFVLIRNDIKYDLNAQIVKNVAEAILERCDEHNRIRKSISSIVASGDTSWNFAHHHNHYVYYELIKDQFAIAALYRFCVVLSQMLENYDYERAYDFVDCIHHIPILISREKKLTNRDIRMADRKFREKWGTSISSYL